MILIINSTKFLENLNVFIDHFVHQFIFLLLLLWIKKKNWLNQRFPCVWDKQNDYLTYS